MINVPGDDEPTVRDTAYGYVSEVRYSGRNTIGKSISVRLAGEVDEIPMLSIGDVEKGDTVVIERAGENREDSDSRLSKAKRI